MILDKEVTIKWSAKNIDYYRNKGYKFHKFGEEFTVKIEELPPNAHAKINVRCDYCQDTKFIKVQSYNKQVKEYIIKKYACKACKEKKVKEGMRILYEQGKIQKGDNYYYSIRENRMKELKEAIEKYGSLDYIYQSNLSQRFQRNNHDLLEAIEELGYNHEDLRQVKPNNYWDDFQNIKDPIEDFISIYKRFPVYEEMSKELKIPTGIIERHGGMNEIKKKIDYKNNDDLIDNRGDYNRSTLELITANFLIAQEISYKREQKPFPKNEGNYRSDFTLHPEKQKPIHIEIWGFSENKKSERAMEYAIKRKKKEKLYEKYAINLISIEPYIFKQSYEKIEKELNNVFSKYLNLKFEKVDQKLLIPARKLTDKQLLNALRKYCEGTNFLPKLDLIYEKESGIYIEITKRYGNIRTFAEKFGLHITTRSAKNYWTEEKIQDKLLYVIQKYGEYYGRDMLKKVEDPLIFGLGAAMHAYGGMKYHRLKLYKHCLENNIPLPEKEQNYIKTRSVRDESMSSDAPLLDIVNDALERINKKVTV